MNVYDYDVFETRFGWMGVVASINGLRRTTLPQNSPDECLVRLGFDTVEFTHSPGRFTGLIDRLSRYFDGENVEMDYQDIDVSDASSFERSSWAACRTIRYGETRTYKWLAIKTGRPNAPRAVGQAMARNRLPIIVPCHRVLASDGQLRGFDGGEKRLDLKKRLLDLENNGTH